MTGKYHAKKVKADGYVFDSKAEYARYCELKLLERAGEIIKLEVHPKFVLLINETLIGTYKPDFRYFANKGGVRIEDVKGVMTAAASLRIRVFEAIYKVPVQIIGKKPRRVRKFKAAA